MHTQQMFAFVIILIVCACMIFAGGENETLTKSSRLLDGSSDFVLTYEDKEGDWMLVGDVPWR